VCTNPRADSLHCTSTVCTICALSMCPTRRWSSLLRVRSASAPLWSLSHPDALTPLTACRLEWRWSGLSFHIQLGNCSHLGSIRRPYNHAYEWVYVHHTLASWMNWLTHISCTRLQVTKAGTGTSTQPNSSSRWEAEWLSLQPTTVSTSMAFWAATSSVHEIPVSRELV
jgi:hypothetical protein